MKKERNFRKALASVVFFALLSFSLVFVGTSSASAYSGAAGGGSVGGGNGSGYVLPGTHWVWGNSLSDLQYARGVGFSGVGGWGAWPNYVTSSSGGQNLLNTCNSPNLKRVYWLQAGNGNVTKVNVTDTNKIPGFPSNDGIDSYASSLRGNGIYLICVIDDTVERSYDVSHYRDRNDGNGKTFTADYSWTTTVNPELNDFNGVDPIGDNNLHSQPASTVKSNYGNVFDNAWSGGGSSDALVNQLQNAINQDRTTNHATVVLDDRNKAGLAEGGVLSVSEQTRMATITVTQQWQDVINEHVTCKYHSNDLNNPIPGTCWSTWGNWVEVPGTRTHAIQKNYGTQPNTGFYQLLSVHCNEKEFDDLTAKLNQLGGTGSYRLISQTTGSTGQTTSVIQTAFFNNRSDALNSGRILGVDSNTLSPEVARTGQLGFYDKECNAACTSNPDPNVGASDQNGAKDNVSDQSSNDNDDTYGGAVLTKIAPRSNSSYFEIFRDNDKNRISVNTWYPVNNGEYTYDGSAPVSTTVTRWSEGTPGVDKNSTGGVFQMTAVNGSGEKALFTNLNGKPAVQKNFGIQPYDSANSTQLKGFYRDFDVQSTWSSQQDKPEVLNVKWEYEPTVNTTFPTNLGFSGVSMPDREIADQNVTIAQKVDVKCYAQFGTYNNTLNIGDEVQQSTGTGSVNTLDSGLVQQANGDDSWQNQSNLVLKFIRGVAN